MVKHHTLALLFALCAGIVLAQDVHPQTSNTYGDVNVSDVLRLDEQVRLHCNLTDLPPVVGQDIPVCINALKPADNAQDNLKLLMYLNDLLLPKDNKPNVLLKNIRRGEQFCLVADIYVNGDNLCDLMVKEGLAHKVIEVDQQSKPSGNNAQTQMKQTSQTNAPSANGEYIASRTSKVFHWANCPHAKRMDKGKAIYFVNPDDAAKTGRRPCKTCQPQ